MKKYLLITISSILILLLSIYTILSFTPSWLLDFNIYPEGLESYDKDIFVKIKFFPLKNFQITNGEFYNSHLKWSPRKRHLAFFEGINISFDKETALNIIKPSTFQIKTIFIGDYHTSDYAWLDDETIRVYVNAGTGVRIYRDIDVNVPEPFIASDHMSPEFWTPEKTF